MGTVGDCFDNAPMESFWGSMQIELLNRKRWTTYVELATAMADCIDNFYNPTRRHSPLGYLTPDEFEALPSKDHPGQDSHRRGPISGVQVRWTVIGGPRQRSAGRVRGGQHRPESRPGTGRSHIAGASIKPRAIQSLLRLIISPMSVGCDISGCTLPRWFPGSSLVPQI